MANRNERGLMLGMKNKGQLGSLQSIIISLVVIGIILGAGFMVLQQYMTSMVTMAATNVNSSAYAAVNTTITAMTTIPTWLTIIVIVAIVGILLAIVFAVLPRSTGGV